jgi:hypothetical protein
MLDLVEEARREDTDDVPPRSVIRGLAQLVPGLRCEFIELDWVTCQVLIGQSTDEDYHGVGFDYLQYLLNGARPASAGRCLRPRSCLCRHRADRWRATPATMAGHQRRLWPSLPLVGVSEPQRLGGSCVSQLSPRKTFPSVER